MHLIINIPENLMESLGRHNEEGISIDLQLEV